MSPEGRKFCMVTTFYPPYNFGGDGVFVRRLANELAERGHHVDVVHCVDSYRLLARGRDRDARYDDHPNVTVHGLRSRAGFLSPLVTQQTAAPGFKAKSLRAILDGQRFDVIHFHNISLIGLGALQYGNAVKLYTMHEHWLVCPMHVLWKFDREPCARKQCLRCTVFGRRPPQLWRYTGRLSRLLRHVDSFIAPSRFTQEKHREMGLQVDAPIVHIPNFLPQPSPPADPPDAPRLRPYFLFIGRFTRMKGADVLVRAFHRFRKADLLLAGAGPEEAGLRKLAHPHGHIEFLGHIPYERLEAYIREAVAVVVPSVGYEVFPTVVLEAFAHQTPVIAHHLGPLPEMIDASGGGMTYTDESSLVAALDRLLTDAPLRKELAGNGYRAYEKHWTPARHLNRYFELIDSLAGTARGVSACE